MKSLEQTWPLCVFWTHVGVHLLPTRVYCGWKSGESSPSVYLGAGTLVGMGCCFVGWKFWILCFTSLGCLRVAPGILDNESWRTRNRLYPSLESDLKRGRGLGSLFPIVARLVFLKLAGELFGVGADPGNWCKGACGLCLCLLSLRA